MPGGSVYGQSSGYGGGSAYGQTGGSLGVKPVHHGGGGIGGFFHSVGHPFESAGHYIGSKASLAGHDIEAMPTGFLQLGKAAAHDAARLNRRIGLPESQASRRMSRGHYELPGLGKQMAKQTYLSLRHPARDPFQTLLSIGAAAAPLAGGVARAGAAADAARAADEAGFVGKAGAVSKALVRKPLMPTRTLRVPTLVKDEAGRTGLPSEEHLLTSPRDRFIPVIYRGPHDISVGEPGGSHLDIPDHGNGVQGYAVIEHGKVHRVNFSSSRAAQQASGARVPEDLGKFSEQYDHNSEVQNAARAAVEDKFGTQALKVEHRPVHLVESHAPLARAAQALHDRILQRSLDKNLTAEKPSMVARYANSRVGKALDEEGRIGRNTRNVAAHILGRVKGFDKGVEPGHGQLALFLRSANVMPHEAADFWREQAAAGVNPAQTSRLARWADQIHQKGMMMIGPDGKVAIDDLHYPKLADVDTLVKENQGVRENFIKDEKLMSPEGVKSRKALVAETMKSESARNPETGVREGQGYTDLSISKKRASLSPFSRSRSSIIPKPKKFSVGKEATGAGVPKGLIPDSTTKTVARSTEDVLREIAKKERRGQIYRYGSDVKRQGDDILIANPHALKQGTIPLDTKQLLGIEHSTLNTLPSEDEAGIAAALKARAEDAIPGRASERAKGFERDAGIGTEAPEGYRWVPRKFAGDLLHETTPRSRFTKGVNSLNSAITAATVYFKLSHIPQRLSTDATTSLLNGALKPSNLLSAGKLRKALSEREYNELAASTGTHGYQALPAEGESKAARAARSGAGFYAHRIDSPFRFANLVHEASKAGMDTPEGMRSLLKAAKDPSKASDRQLSVLKRANRVSMIYDGLGPAEQRVIARGLWFYPWTKASVRFAGHTITEHPLASVLGGALGKQGEKVQSKQLGPLPYYEFGLSPVGKNLVSNFNSLSPFGTAANVAETPAHLEMIRGNLNPASAALTDLLTGTNSYGKPENRGIAALADLSAPTPEGQILAAYLARHKDQSKKMFPNSGAWAGTRDPLLRALGGQPVPRHVNRAALKKATQKWRTISIPAP